MNFLIPPWQHQLDAIEKAKNLPYFALFFEMGAGKTMAAINILRAKMMTTGRFLRTIIFCPPIVIPNWKDEFLMHSKIPEDRIILLDGSTKERIATFKENAWGLDPKTGKFAPRPAFFVTNYESLLLGGLYQGKEKAKRYLPGELFTLFQKWGPDALVFDESHRLKNHKAERSKQADRLANPRNVRKPLCYLLTGSPVLNSPLDLFHQFKIMDGGVTFTKNFFIFRGKYFEDENAGMLKSKDSAQRYFPKWKVKPGGLEAINALIYKAGMRVTKEECLDLPEELSVTIKCKLLPEQIKNYKEMKQDFITFVNDSSATATLAIVKALRLLQITSGFLTLNPTGLENETAQHVYKETAKEAALKELLEELTPHSKVIVWAVWKENYGAIRRVCDELKIKYVEVHGLISRSKQTENVDSFKSDPDVRVFIGHPGSGGIGINLTCAPYSIFFSRTFSLEHWLQARARNHRGGQKEKVTHYDLVCTSTIDELVQKKLQSKLDMSNQVLSSLSTELKNEKDIY